MNPNVVSWAMEEVAAADRNAVVAIDSLRAQLTAESAARARYAADLDNVRNICASALEDVAAAKQELAECRVKLAKSETMVAELQRSIADHKAREASMMMMHQDMQRENTVVSEQAPVSYELQIQQRDLNGLIRSAMLIPRGT